MNDTEQACPLCQETIPGNAEMCSHCGERIKGKPCDDCLTLCPENAKVCRWCGFKFRLETETIGIDEFVINARFLPTLLIRSRLLCESIRFNEEKVVISTPGLFRLWVNEAEVPWNKVAGFDYRSGIFWDSVLIETRGQKPTMIRCLSKADGERFREILRSLEE